MSAQMVPPATAPTNATAAAASTMDFPYEHRNYGRAEAMSMPVEDIDVSNAYWFQSDQIGHFFERLRRDDPVHLQENQRYGRFWSVTKYKDIMHVDTNHGIYSSDWTQGGIAIFNAPLEQRLQMFIAMDQPKHDVQRKAVSPIVAPGNLATMEATIRERTCRVLDGLPRNETFNWVERVSIELTTMMLATLFDFPMEDRKLLTWWSDVATSVPELDKLVESPEARLAELGKMLAYFTKLWNERVNAPPTNDLISMLAHNPATRNMGPMEYMGNLVLLIVGGNDTTRNSMTGGVLAMSKFPSEWDKLKANPKLIDSMVPEIIRWQTPLPMMRRTALKDTELGGKQIKQGDKVVMWYLSGNRDEEVIQRPNDFIIDRARPREHLSFGFGIHRCVGNRLAEMQLKILWEEMLKRFDEIEVMGEPKRLLSNFVRGITHLPVRLPT